MKEWFMDLGPLVSSMMRNKTGAILVALQIAVGAQPTVVTVDHAAPKFSGQPGYGGGVLGVAIPSDRRAFRSSLTPRHTRTHDRE